MSGNPHRQTAPSTSNRWLSNILRPRASSISVESCINVNREDTTCPLDARPIVSLVGSAQPLAQRCKHLKEFGDLCKQYKFTHLDNVFFSVQDILEPSVPREARHVVFEFMLACIQGQYEELGMARVTFYSWLRDHALWDDFDDMIQVLDALCKGGREVSGFEKNIGKLLITWLEHALQCAPPDDQNSSIPHLRDILRLLTALGKFNFSLLSEDAVQHMIEAVRHAIYVAKHPTDLAACLAFADVVVRYRFVPFAALSPFLEILAVSVILPETMVPDGIDSPWSIFTNLLRSHCAHNAVLTLCRMTEGKGPNAVLLARGAIRLLTEAAWGSKLRAHVADTYQVPDAVILTYFRRAALRCDKQVSEKIMLSLRTITESGVSVGLLEWETIWDIVDSCANHLLVNMDDRAKSALLLFPESLGENEKDMPGELVQFLVSIQQKKADGTYAGPVDRFVDVLHTLRQYLSSEAAWMLLNYYEAEHAFLPSSEDWLVALRDTVDTFYIPSSMACSVRLRVLSIVTDTCIAVKDFYAAEMNREIVYPIVANTPDEADPEIRQRAVDLMVTALADTDPADETFDKLLNVLRKCTPCKCMSDTIHVPASSEAPGTAASATQLSSAKEEPLRIVTLRRSQSQSQPSHAAALRQSARSSSTSPLRSSSPTVSLETGHPDDGSCCTGVPAMCGLVELFEEFLPKSNGTACLKVFNTIAGVANNMDDLLCPYGGPKIVAFDLLLRLRCLADHRIYTISDPVGNENTLMAAIRHARQTKKAEEDRKMSASMPGPPKSAESEQAPVVSPSVVAHKETPNETMFELPVQDICKAYIMILTHSSNWVLLHFVLKRLPIQLTNKHFFCAATSQIQKLRRNLFKWIVNKKFLDSVHSLPPTVKRNDLNVYAYKLLMVLVSYRRIFSKQDQDELVYAFYMGITQVTAATKPCIHAMTVCCHELPLSMAKMLNEILQRMSQIISVSSVSVHILEFLLGLARLPNLYANFTSDMYKPVFAIALNYLQHSQAQQQASPLNTPSGPGGSPTSNSPLPGAATPQQPPSNQSALSQYVFIMAYLVITVWFTAVPLHERRKHVSFIIQRLLGANTVSRGIDEQTYTCIDMLSRFSFADVSLAPEKSFVSKVLMGDPSAGPSPPAIENGPRQSMRTWVYGHTLLTLKTAKALGWMEVTIRRPSGTVSMMCNIENRIKSDEIDYKTLPALLMMQYSPDLLPARAYEASDSQVDQPESTPSSSENAEGSGLGITFDERSIEEESIAQDSPASSDALSSRRPSITQRALMDLLNINRSPPPSNSISPDGTPTSPRSVMDELNQNQTSHVQPPLSHSERLSQVVRQVLSDPTSDAAGQTVQHLRRLEQSFDAGFLYLQLSNYPDLARTAEMSPPLPDDEATARSIGLLDRIPVVDYHKIGVLYVGKGQTKETEILANTHGSPDYVKLLSALGTIEPLRGRTDNTGGLDREMDIDGKYAYFWQDDVTKVIFHVATMMPTHLDRDPQCSGKKRHIGNDFVTIVYNDADKPYAFDTLPGQFNFINIVISPHSVSNDENTFFKVEMQRRPDMPEIGPITEPKLVSSQSLPGFVRQMALHANIFAQVFLQSRVEGRHEYVSHWRERLRAIKRIKERRAEQQQQQQQQSAQPSAQPPQATPSQQQHPHHQHPYQHQHQTSSSSGKTGTPLPPPPHMPAFVPAEQALDFTRYT